MALEEGTRISTLNPPAESSPAAETLNESGAPSTPMKSDDGLISTVEFEPVKEEGPAEKPQEEGAVEAKPPAEGNPAEEGEDGEPKGPVPYERFKKKVESEKALSKQLEDATKRITELEASRQQPPPAAEQKPAAQEQQVNFVDLTQKTDSEIADWFDDSPLEFMGNFARQVVHETTQAVMKHLNVMGSRSAYEQDVAAFAGKNEGFQAMMDSGKINAYIASHPGHNVFSAFHALTESDKEAAIQKRVDEAVAAALKEKTKEFTINQKAKHELRPVSTPGPAAHQNANDNELHDTKAQGGLISVIAGRLKRSRQAAQ